MVSNLESVQVAIEWWVNKISHPKMFSNGDESDINQFAAFLASMFAYKMSRELTLEQIEIFKESLDEKISSEIVDKGFCVLRTDYEPQDVLAQAAASAGIDSALFPWKTYMNVTENSVKVRSAYGADSETIFSSKEKNFIMKT